MLLTPTFHALSKPVCVCVSVCLSVCLSLKIWNTAAKPLSRTFSVSGGMISSGGWRLKSVFGFLGARRCADEDSGCDCVFFRKHRSWIMDSAQLSRRLELPAQVYVHCSPTLSWGEFSMRLKNNFSGTVRCVLCFGRTRVMDCNSC